MRTINKTLLAALFTLLSVGAQGDPGIVQPGIGIADGIGFSSVPTWVLPGFGTQQSRDCYFSRGLSFPSATACSLTVTRASAGTNLLPTSDSGAAFATFGNNVARLTLGLGLLVEEARTNFLLNSTVPATQTTGSLGTGTYSLWVNGTGSAVGTAGTGVGCPVSTSATQGVPLAFTISIAGTCIFTVVGSLNAFQLELNPGAVSAPTSLIVTAGATATRAADAVTLAQMPTFGGNYTIYAAGTPFAPTIYATIQEFISANDATANNRSELTRAVATGNTSIFANAGGVTVWSTTFTPVLAAATLAKVAGSFAPSNQASVGNGGTIHTNSSGTPISSPAITQVQIGAELATRFFNGYISRIAIASRTALPAATLQAITNLNEFN